VCQICVEPSLPFSLVSSSKSFGKLISKKKEKSSSKKFSSALPSKVHTDNPVGSLHPGGGGAAFLRSLMIMGVPVPTKKFHFQFWKKKKTLIFSILSVWKIPIAITVLL
jgi:hypothetical protein